MKSELSAGGVVYRQKRKKIEILLLQDPRGEWTFPKGLIEEDEERVDAARREVQEEVGLKSLEYIDSVDSIQYFYNLNCNTIRKMVYYFLFRHTGRERPKPQKEEGIRAVQWFSPADASELLGYKYTNARVLEKALKKIEEQ